MCLQNMWPKPFWSCIKIANIARTKHKSVLLGWDFWRWLTQQNCLVLLCIPGIIFIDTTYDPGYLRQYLFFLNKLVNYYRSLHMSHLNKGEHLSFLARSTPKRVGFSKGQLIVKPWIIPKNKQMNLFLLVCNVFSFVFWKKLRTPKRHLEII